MRHRPAVFPFLALFVAFIVMPLSSMELNSGLVKLVVNDITGRVAFYRMAEVGRNRYEPLLFDQDSRTTFPTLSLDSRYYRLGESTEFRFSLSRITDGVIIYFKSASCVVRQRIELVKSAGAASADTFRMSFDIENHGSQDIRVGFRMLLDTWLGEESGQHFSTGTQSKVTEETRILKENAEQAITSPGEYATLRIDLAGEGVTPPDEIVLANWKRLSDSDWSFEASGLRGFSFAPFSINDSAVALYWFPENLAKGAVRKISCNLVSLPGKAQASRSASDTTKASSVPLITAKPADPLVSGQSTGSLPPLSTSGSAIAESPALVPIVVPQTVSSPVAIPSASADAPKTGTTVPVPVTIPAATSTSGAVSPPGPAILPAVAVAVTPVPVTAVSPVSVTPVTVAPVTVAPVTVAPAAAAATKAATDATAALPGAVADKAQRDADFAELWALLDKINSGIKNPGSVTDAQLAVWKNRLAVLQSRFYGM